MNICILKGNLCKNPELKFSKGNGMAILKFSLAVVRVKKDDGADFINCIAFGKTAEMIEKYFKKGNPILIEGHIQTGSYDNKEGNKVYTTDIIVNRFEFVGSKKESTTSYDNYTEVKDDSIPF